MFDLPTELPVENLAERRLVDQISIASAFGFQFCGHSFVNLFVPQGLNREPCSA
jgi:hypothetical protein